MRLTKTFLIFALFCLPSWAAISRTGSCSAAATSCTLSAVNTGDLVLVFAYRDASTTAPSLPASNTNITTQATAATGTVGSFRVYCRKASSGSDTGTGTATNASRIAAISYSGTDIQATADCPTSAIYWQSSQTANAKTSTTATFPALTLTDATSWVVGFIGNSAGGLCAPTGLSSVTSNGAGPAVQANDSNGTLSSWASTNCTVTSGTWMTGVVQVLAAVTTGTPNIVQGKGTPNGENGGETVRAGGSFTIPLFNPSLSGNSILVMWMVQRSGGGLDPGTMTVTDDGSNKYFLSSNFTGVSCNANGNYLFAAIAPNAATGTRVITISPQQALVYWTAKAMELNGIDQASPFDAFGCNAGGSGTTITSGAIVPTRIGDFIAHFAWDEVDAAPGLVTVGSQSNITWRLRSVDRVQGSMLQTGVYSSTSSITPTFTVANNNGWSSIAVALKPATAGTAKPGGEHVFWVHDHTITSGFATSYTLQIPTASGNALVDMFSGGGTSGITSTSSTPSNTITAPDGSVNGAGALFVQAEVICNSSVTNNQVLWDFTQGGGTTSDYNHNIYDIEGAATSCVGAHNTATGNQSGATGPWDTVSITPTSSSSIIFADVPVDFNTVNACNTTNAKLQNGFLGTNSTGNTFYYENNGWCSLINTSTASKTFNYSAQSGLGANIANWAAQAIEILAPSVGPAFVMRHK